jgi:importin subunit beta-1
MRHQNDRVILQAVEFWSTICEIEIELASEYEEVSFILSFA